MGLNYSGIWPVAPTPFHDDGSLDFESMARVLDFLIDQGADGICILANFSEQFLISDAERETLTRRSLEHVAGGVPMIIGYLIFQKRVTEAVMISAGVKG